MSNKANDTIQYIYKLTAYSTNQEELKEIVDNLGTISYELTKEVVLESALLEKLVDKKPNMNVYPTKTWNEMMADFGLTDPDWKPDTTDF